MQLFEQLQEFNMGLYGGGAQIVGWPRAVAYFQTKSCKIVSLCT